MSKTFKLNETETAILAMASGRRNGSILPMPEGIDATSTKAKRAVGRLAAANLFAERSTSSAASAWRTDEAGQHHAMRITSLGRAALSGAPAAGEPASVPQDPPEAIVLGFAGPRGKLGAVLAAVRQAEGAALTELTTITGWQPHTIRASITRLRQSGFAIQMTTTHKGRRYVAGEAACEARP